MLGGVSRRSATHNHPKLATSLTVTRGCDQHLTSALNMHMLEMLSSGHTNYCQATTCKRCKQHGCVTHDAKQPDQYEVHVICTLH